MKKTITENGILYVLDEETGTYIPQISVPEEKPLGKYGRTRWKYLKENQHAYYTALLLSGKLNEHCAEIDDTAYEYVQRIVKSMAKEDNLSENLKNTDPLKWIGMMNNYKACAEEFVYRELIYV